MRRDIVARIKECWIQLARDIEDDGTCDTTMLIAHCEKEGVQAQLKFTKEEDDFMTTGHGEIQL